MRIKFLSIIASFFMVSLLITSCLDNDNEVNYSPDATIHAFELDTIGYGKTYKFTIDQINRLIYNEDSIPVHADTIIDRILIKTLSTASGIVTMKTKDGKNDSIINLNDSIDLSPYINKETDKYLKIKVWAPDMLEEHTKEYKIGIRKHNYDPDSLRWDYKGVTQIPNNTEQISVLLNKDIKTYTVENGALKVYTISTESPTMNAPAAVAGDYFNNQLPTSIIEYDKMLYATSSNSTKVYQSTDGITWEENTTLFKGEVVMLLAPYKPLNKPLDNKITYIVKSNGIKYFNSTDKITSARETTDLQKVPGNFPTKNISYTAYETKTNISGIVLVGEYETAQPTVEGEKVIVPWAYMGGEWTPFPPNNVATSCPALERPSIVYYNEQFYIFGSGFETFYTALGSSFIAWNKANNKFSFPNYAKWGDPSTPSYAPDKTPEFRGRNVYSTVLDEEDYIWVLFSGGTATVKETIETPDETRATTEKEYPYVYGSEVWRGRLNQLWFDKANKKNTY